MQENRPSIVKVFKTEVGERKDIENVLANKEKSQAILEYIAALDYPEVYEEEDLRNE